MALRSPICTVMGHVDHGKSSVLDYIRGSCIVKSEAGAITQAIGASIVPLETIKAVCGSLLQSLKMNFTIPGLLFIDTPGHAAFTNLRKRGGNLADIAILVIDINEGIMPQTQESIEILRQYKTPFIIALNKVDLIKGWKTQPTSLISSIGQQNELAIEQLETKLYNVVGKLSELGLNADRFDRVDDYTKILAIVPCSAKTGEGIPELVMVLAGLAQKFLEMGLKFNPEGPAKGTILEIKEDKGIGATADVIIYDGTLSTGDTIVIAGLDKPIITKVKSLFEPAPLTEMRDKKSKFRPVKQVTAATGVKISAPEIENALSGMPLRSCTESEVDTIIAEVQQEIEEVTLETDEEGIVIKADTLGSLEALVKLLKESNIPIKRASIGAITRKDIAEAQTISEKDPLMGVILAFNIKEPEEKSSVKIIARDVIYKIIEDYAAWKTAKHKELQKKEIEHLVHPCKIKVLKGYVFRQSNPAICGVEVMAGTLKTGMPLMDNEGNELTEVKGLQADKEKVEQAELGKQVAASMPGITIGRQVKEEDFLYAAISEDHFRALKDHKDLLTSDEKSAIKEIAEIRRKKNVVWGV